MMNRQVAAPSRQPTTRWWRLDPRVAQHLRASSGPLASLLAGALAPVRRTVNAGASPSHAFAATKWADTEWADTCSDPMAD
jgi:hypothetical protein